MTKEEAESYGWGEQAEAFAAWRNKVDRAVEQVSGASLDDLPDMDFASRFEAGMSPTAVAYEVLENAGFPFDEEE